VSRKRWWETGEGSIEGEAKAFENAGLAFELDRELFERDEIVVFRGDLRLDDRRVAVEVRYPPSYGEGEPVVVIAKPLPIGRHRTLDGVLCLDHPVPSWVRSTRSFKREPASVGRFLPEHLESRNISRNSRARRRDRDRYARWRWLCAEADGLLQPGDEVTIDFEGLGALTNPVRALDGDGARLAFRR
jgi:hypothetical protein